MNAANPAQASTPPNAPGFVTAAAQGYDEDDVAIGCECAYPSLQIEVWHSEAGAQPLHNCY